MEEILINCLVILQSFITLTNASGTKALLVPV